MCQEVQIKCLRGCNIHLNKDQFGFKVVQFQTITTVRKNSSRYEIKIDRYIWQALFLTKLVKDL